MPDLPQSIALDLTRYSEQTRRFLYDRLVEIQFGSPEPLEDPKEEAPGAPHTPDESRLQVVNLFGRWFASWVNLNEPATVPEHLRFELVRIQVNPGNPQDILLYEV